MFGNKITDKISRTLTHNNLETAKSEHETLKKWYKSPEERGNIFGNLRLI